jgi:hypothetical protein
VSTILEAERELERRGGRPPRRSPVPDPDRRRWRIPAIAVIVLAVGGTVWLWTSPRSETPPRAPVEPPVPALEPPAPALADAPRPEPPFGDTAEPAKPAEPKEDPPRGRVLEQRRARFPEREERGAAARQPRPAPGDGADEEVIGGAPSVATGVTLVDIHCSRDGTSCRAQLVINGRGVSLGQGQSFDGVEVQLVLADTVYVRQGGNVLALKPGW